MKDNSGHSEGGEVPKLEERLMKEPTSKAIKDCTNWLIYCLDIGWQKEQLYYLQKIWWEHHDEKGNLTSTGSVAAPKPDTERIFSGTPEETLDELKSTGDAYYHHSQLEPVIALLQKEIANHRAVNSLLMDDDKEVTLANKNFELIRELAAAKESIKELIPIAEDRLFSVPVKSLDEVNEIVRRAKALLEH